MKQEIFCVLYVLSNLIIIYLLLKNNGNNNWINICTIWINVCDAHKEAEQYY